ncbi:MULTISPECIES: ABC transporter substrate-binding protein [unclassified Paludibacterium]|uniref:substrate-binding periplasmic protein n=1 Tax=unclassified Paludibacterium TaxID=2618429 RepID=UPI001C04B346|nr:transporter substrate-binding domain-containing protein [Paludibacterium sp. B53371]BEV73753.1 ABC transporter substrate-binding protein [Paludibacterium sp. THUN1379]
MTRYLRRVLLCCGLSLMTAASADPARLVRLATLEWPPYNSAALPAGGFNTALVREALRLSGYRLEVVTLPWNSAVYKGLHDPRFDGYFPEYVSPAVRRNCFLSERAGESPVVLAKRTGKDYLVRGVTDLRHYLVGVVNGYNNTEAFDANVAKGVQRVDVAASDEQNLVKLVHGRVDLIIIDRYVMQWLLSNSARLAGIGSKVQTMEPPLQVQGLYVCFKRESRGQKLADRFSAGLRQIDVDRFTADYLAGLPH